jgi:hypothetical protein
MKYIDKKNLTDEQLKKLALKECKLLVNYFSKEEIDKLNLELIEPDMEHSCVYGLMTGSCNSERVNNFTKTLEEVIIVSNCTEELEKRSLKYVTPLEEFIYKDTETEIYEDSYDIDQDYSVKLPNTTLILNEIKRLQNEL